jgi:hypothetical protein
MSNRNPTVTNLARTTNPALALRRSPRRVATSSAALCLSLAAGLAHAALPGVLDRVPGDAPVVVTISSVGAIGDRTALLAQAGGRMLPAGGDALTTLTGLTKADGLAQDKPLAAFAVRKKDAPPASAKDASPLDRFDVFALVPVTDFAALATSIKAEGDGALRSATIGGQAMYLRDVGSGLALAGNSRGAVESFVLPADQLAAHAKVLGAVGERVADGAQVLIIGNIAQLQDELEATAANAKSDMQERLGMMAMGIPGGAEGMATQAERFASVLRNFARDAQVGIVGIGAADHGTWLDIGAQFKPDSALARTFSDGGDSKAIVARLPRQEFLFVGAMDTSTPGIKGVMREMGKDAAKPDPKQDPLAAVAALGSASEPGEADSVAMFMGTSAGGLMGGMFSNAVMLSGLKAPGATLDTLKANITALNGASAKGITVKTTLKDGEDIGGRTAAMWRVNLSADPNKPEAGQAVAALQMAGQGAMAGYAATTENFLVSTMGLNKPLMRAALEAASNGNGASGDADILALQPHLLPSRNAEAYLGVRPMLEMAQGFLMMMGPLEWDLPEHVPPIGITADLSSQAALARIYVPSDTAAAITGLISAVEKAQQPMQGEGEDDEEGAPPRF